jgi:hypothetical protein
MSAFDPKRASQGAVLTISSAQVDPDHVELTTAAATHTAVAHFSSLCVACWSMASLRLFVSTPHACDIFGLAGNSDVGAAKVIARLSAHAVDASIGPFQAIFIALPIALRPIGRRLARG